MADDALLNWLNNGAPVALDSEAAKEAAAAKRRVDFSQRFFAAMNPADDLGPTEEIHQASVAYRVFVVHDELRALGIDEYDACWRLMDAPTRAALKRYIQLAKRENHV